MSTAREADAIELAAGNAPLLVVGGRQRRDAVDRDEWQAYDEARVLRVDPVRGEVETLITYRSPAEHLAPESPSILFKAGTLLGDRLWLCTTTEVVVYRLGSAQLERVWSHPWLNDVHHVLPRRDGGWVVADTGLDFVLEVSPEGEIEASWPAGDADPWQRFDRSTDWRRVATTKPHEVHVNFVFEAEGHLWGTRFFREDAVRLDQRQLSLDLYATRGDSSVERGSAGPHDGIVAGDEIHFTTVDGRVVRWPRDLRGAARAVELEIPATYEHGGWCRGIAPLADDQAWVGFSRLRTTRFRRHVSWLKHGLRRVGQYATAPTRIARHDLRDGKLLQQIDLEPHLAALFSIHVLS